MASRTAGTIPAWEVQAAPSGNCLSKEDSEAPERDTHSVFGTSLEVFRAQRDKPMAGVIFVLGDNTTLSVRVD